MSNPTEFDIDCIVAPAEDAPASTAKEYGIAPATFGLISPVSPSVRAFEDGTPDSADRSEADSGVLPDLSANALKDSDNPQQQRQPATIRANKYRVARGIVNAVAHGSQRYSSRSVSQRPKPRTLVWCPTRSNARFRQAVRRAFGRIQHVQRALRPRSPPGR